MGIKESVDAVIQQDKKTQEALKKLQILTTEMNNTNVVSYPIKQIVFRRWQETLTEVNKVLQDSFE